MVEVAVLQQLLADKNVEGVKKFIEDNELEIRNGKIYPKNQNMLIDQEKYFDRRQMVQKILQNSGFGAVVNPASRFNDKRVGQSITLNGKLTCKHMNSFVNECITGKYEIEGDAIIAIDTDSISADSVIDTSNGKLTIEELFTISNHFDEEGKKEYGYNNNLKVRTYDPETKETYFENIDYVYRHKVSKEQWEIEDESGNKICVTSDHSIMVERDGQLLECKPMDIRDTDLLISVIDDK